MAISNGAVLAYLRKLLATVRYARDYSVFIC
ncbi:hypothetical protein OE09_2070 [Flavobacteriaceae bacterium MAR_2010_72]|nr:hypothetical protein OE09_2070 [Flavobacteriaceae bacterium MAR_2010_72]